MNMLRYKDYTARIEFDAEDEIFTGRLAGINDVVGFHGASVDEIKAAFHEAVDDYLATCAKVGKSPQKSYSGTLTLRVDPKVHEWAALAAELAGQSLNQWGTEIIAEAVKGVWHALRDHEHPSELDRLVDSNKAMRAGVEEKRSTAPVKKAKTAPSI
jgi:predicted HicB family RNase H-like nuclease